MAIKNVIGLKRLLPRKRIPERNPSEVKHSLEVRLDRLTGLLEFFTVTVVIGLIAEYLPAVLGMVKAHKFDPHIIGGIAVTVGVAGELLVGFFASRCDGELRAINNLIIAETTERAVKSELQTAELLSRMQPRSLTLEQQRSIGNALRRFCGQKVQVWSYNWDPEAYMFSKQIISALQFGSLLVIDNSGKSGSSGAALETGITINWWLTKDFAVRLGEALEATGGVSNVVVREGPSSIATNEGLVPSPEPLLSIWVKAKPFDVLLV